VQEAPLEVGIEEVSADSHISRHLMRFN